MRRPVNPSARTLSGSGSRSRLLQLKFKPKRGSCDDSSCNFFLPSFSFLTPLSLLLDANKGGIGRGFRGLKRERELVGKGNKGR